jgi:hypothetical protein
MAGPGTGLWRDDTGWARGCPGRSSNTTAMGSTRVSRPIRAPISGAARPRPEPSPAWPGEDAGWPPPTPGRRSSGSADGAAWAASLTSASSRPSCGMGLCSSSHWLAQRSSEGGSGGKASTELRLWDNCGDRGGGSESMERGKEQVQRRCRRGYGPGRDDAERPVEDRGWTRRTGSPNWLIKSASGSNWLEGFWHRCRGRSQGPGFCALPSGMTRRARSAEAGPMAKQADLATPPGAGGQP